MSANSTEKPNGLLPTHLDRFPPEMFGNTTFDLMSKADKLGVEDELSIRTLNVQRYMRNLEILEKDGMKLSIMPDQTQEMVLTAIYQNIESFRFVREQTPAVCEVAISLKPELIEFVRNQTDDLIEYVIEKKPFLISFVKNPKTVHLEMCLDKCWDNLRHFKKEWIDEHIVKYAINSYVEQGNKVNYPTFSSIKLNTPLNYIPQTQDLVDYAIDKHYSLIVGVHKEFIKENVLHSCIETDPLIIGFLPEEFHRKDLIFKIIDLALKMKHPPYLLRLVSLINPNEWDEDVAIYLLKVFYDIYSYGNFIDLNLKSIVDSDENLIRCKPTFDKPTPKMINMAYGFGYKYFNKYLDLSFSPEGNERAKAIIKNNPKEYRNFDTADKSFGRWLYSLGVRLNFV